MTAALAVLAALVSAAVSAVGLLAWRLGRASAEARRLEAEADAHARTRRAIDEAADETLDPAAARDALRTRGLRPRGGTRIDGGRHRR